MWNWLLPSVFFYFSAPSKFSTAELPSPLGGDFPSGQFAVSNPFSTYCLTTLLPITFRFFFFFRSVQVLHHRRRRGTSHRVPHQGTRQFSLRHRCRKSSAAFLLATDRKKSKGQRLCNSSRFFLWLYLIIVNWKWWNCEDVRRRSPAKWAEKGIKKSKCW